MSEISAKDEQNLKEDQEARKWRAAEQELQKARKEADDNRKRLETLMEENKALKQQITAGGSGVQMPENFEKFDISEDSDQQDGEIIP